MENIKIWWYGQSAFKLEIGKKVLLMDPWLNENPISPVKSDDITKVDVITVSHGHSDHLGDAFSIREKTGAEIVCSPEIGYYMKDIGFGAGMRIAQGGTIDFDDFKVSAVNAVHPSALFVKNKEGIEVRLPGGTAFGFVITTKEGNTIYHAGDTDLFLDMKLIADRYHPAVAILPIGGRFTMDIETAVLACDYLKPRVVIPMHYNATPLTMADPDEFVAKMHAAHPEIAVVVLSPGEKYEYFGQ